MKDGFVRLGVCTPAGRVGDPVKNAAGAVAAARRAAEAGVKVLAFPELTLTGYTCGDLFYHDTLLQAAEDGLAAYVRETASLDLISFIGLPVAVGDKIYNCAAAVCRGTLLGLVPKTYLPNDHEFSEARQFSPAPDGIREAEFAGRKTLFGRDLLFTCRQMPALRISAEICEDLWVSVPPSCAHTAAGATVIVNLSASDETVGKAEVRRSLVKGQSMRTRCAYLYANAGEGESGTDAVYAAHNLIASEGALLAEAEPFAADSFRYAEADLGRILYDRRTATTFLPRCDGYAHVPFDLSLCETELSCPPPRFPFVPDDAAELRERCETILNIQSRGLAGRMARAFAKTAVIGVSGGLDSTLALLVAVRAADLLKRDRKTVIAVTMPCFGTTARTKSNAERLAEELGTSLRVVDIKEAVGVHFRDIGHAEDNFDVVYENAQARERTQVLMDIANAEGGLVVGTGDLSELALGWATYNGDHMSMYGVNSDVPKTMMRHIVSYYADREEEAGRAGVAGILRDVLATPVSPELLPPKDGEIAQCTEGIVGPYELHDYFLYHFLRDGASPEKIYRLARATFRGVYDDEVIYGWLRVFVRRFFSQQFKRSCLPDGPKVGSVGLSPRGDLRMPSDADASAWLAFFEK